MGTSNAYPSLSEYYFYRMPINIKNLGCTKINLSEYTLLYRIYQNDVVLASKVNDLTEQSIGWMVKDNLLYPEQFTILEVGFGEENLAPEPVKSENPNNFILKMCLINKISRTPISCDQTTFNIEYKKVS